jgi:hypothetical protein
MDMANYFPAGTGRLMFLSLIAMILTLSAANTASAQGASGWLPQIQVAGTYSYLRGKPDNSNPDLNLSGASESLAFSFSSRFSAVAEAGQYRFTDLPTGLSSTMYTYMFGPRMTLFRFGRFDTFGEVLVGGGRLDANSGAISAGENGLALTVGGGVDVPLRGRFTLRALQADYMLTRYNSEAGASATQNHLRISAGLVVRFGGR